MFKTWMVMTAIVLAASTPGIALPSVDSSSPAQPERLISDFSGTWTVRWLSNDSRNPMKLAQKVTYFTGVYINDAKDNCSVSGALDTTNQLIKLQVKCPKWDIQMEGFPTLDGKTIVGEYLAYGKAAGGFIMTRE